MENEKLKEVIARYGIDLRALEQEQTKLAKQLEIKDIVDLKRARLIGAVENIIVKNKIISAIVVVSVEEGENGEKNFEIVEQEYFLASLRFPYIHGFKAYRELPSMVSAYGKLRDKPDIVLVRGEGINHARLGVASQFSLSVGVSAIGVNDKLYDGNEIKKGEVYMFDKKVGMMLRTKEGSKPLFICPGDKVGIDSSYDFVKELVVEPHKMPEPLHLAHRYAREIKKEMGMK